MNSLDQGRYSYSSTFAKKSQLGHTFFLVKFEYNISIFLPGQFKILNAKHFYLWFPLDDQNEMIRKHADLSSRFIWLPLCTYIVTV